MEPNCWFGNECSFLKVKINFVLERELHFSIFSFKFLTLELFPEHSRIEPNWTTDPGRQLHRWGGAMGLTRHEPHGRQALKSVS
jgi:hypothetical protein